MGEPAVKMRSFNRFYTQHIGILTDRYLGQDRPLAEARLLFEIGSSGATVRELRQRLGLDSGYVSRLLRSLERGGMVETFTNSDGDRRVRTVRPTPAGRVELDEINRRADADAARLLDGLDPLERQELLDALATVERILRRSAATSAQDVTIRSAATADASAIATLLVKAFADQRPQFTAEAFSASTPTPDALAERVTTDPVWVAEQGGRIVGTISATSRTQVLWVRSLAVLPEARGARIADRLLTEVENYAVDHGFDRLELDTTPFQLAAARSYERFGFRAVRRHEFHGTPMIRMTKPLGATCSARSGC